MNSVWIISIPLFLFTCLSGYSQTFDANSKVQGKLITSQETMEGTLDINLEMNQVLFSRDNQIKIYAASQFQQIILDQKPAYLTADLEGEIYLFEVISFGQVTILYREGVIKDEFTYKTYNPYFSKTDKGLQELSRKKDFLSLFGSDEKWMELHIENDHLDLKKKEDIRIAFNYYNQTFEATSPSP